LGLKSSKTTEIYTYLTTTSLQNIKSPFDSTRICQLTNPCLPRYGIQWAGRRPTRPCVAAMAEQGGPKDHYLENIKNLTYLNSEKRSKKFLHRNNRLRGLTLTNLSLNLVKISERFRQPCVNAEVGYDAGAWQNRQSLLTILGSIDI